MIAPRVTHFTDQRKHCLSGIFFAHDGHLLFTRRRPNPPSNPQTLLLHRPFPCQQIHRAISVDRQPAKPARELMHHQPGRDDTPHRSCFGRCNCLAEHRPPGTASFDNAHAWPYHRPPARGSLRPASVHPPRTGSFDQPTERSPPGHRSNPHSKTPPGPVAVLGR